MKTRFIAIAIMAIQSGICLAETHISVVVENTLKQARTDVPVVLNISNHTVGSAVVTYKGVEIPYQLDDLNQDTKYDELVFMTDLDKKETKTFDITLLDEGTPREYPSRVYAEMLLNNPKEKGKRQTSYISSLTVDGDVNPYNLLQHHGPAFESELVAYRIYFDKRQTVDIYGKYNKGLELKQTQFYPTKEELAQGFGDDCLWVGSTLGLGTLRGWDGSKPSFLDKVAHRTERIIARGPLRTVVEVVDNKWDTDNANKKTVDMTTRYTLYAGHRDVNVDIRFEANTDDYTLCTGIINVKNSTEYSDSKGLRGCWGTDWPVSEKDSAGHKRETVGLGIYIPSAHFVKEMQKDNDNYPVLVKPTGATLKYHICFASDNETFGYHSDKDFYKYLTEWKKELDNPVKVESISKQ